MLQRLINQSFCKTLYIFKRLLVNHCKTFYILTSLISYSLQLKVHVKATHVLASIWLQLHVISRMYKLISQRVALCYDIG